MHQWGGMEIRKIQTTAGGTFLVTIPKDWVSRMGLEKGGHVHMDLDEENLVISAVNRRQVTQPRPLEIDKILDKKMLELSIGAAYIQGHDVTEIATEDAVLPEQKKRWIRETVDNLIGVEVSEEYSDRMVLQNIVDPRTFDLDRSMRKFSDSSLAVLSDAIVGLKRSDTALAQDAYERGMLSTKFYKLLMRLALQILRNRKLREELKIYNPDGLVARLMAVKDLGRSAYYAYRVAQHVTELERLDSGTMAAVEKMARTTIRMQEDAFDAFMKKDLGLASRVIDRMDEVRRSYQTTFPSLPKDQGEKKALAYSLIVRDIRGIAGYAVALADDAVLAAFF